MYDVKMFRFVYKHMLAFYDDANMSVRHEAIYFDVRI